MKILIYFFNFNKQNFFKSGQAIYKESLIQYEYTTQ